MLIHARCGTDSLKTMVISFSNALTRVRCANVLKHKSRSRTIGWQNTIEWLNSTRGWTTKLQKDIVCFAFSSTVYHIWKERNHRLYQQHAKSQEMTLKDIIQSITYSMGTWRKYKHNKFNW